MREKCYFIFFIDFFFVIISLLFQCLLLSLKGLNVKLPLKKKEKNFINNSRHNSNKLELVIIVSSFVSYKKLSKRSNVHAATLLRVTLETQKMNSGSHFLDFPMLAINEK